MCNLCVLVSDEISGEMWEERERVVAVVVVGVFFRFSRGRVRELRLQFRERESVAGFQSSALLPATSVCFHLIIIILLDN